MKGGKGAQCKYCGEALLGQADREFTTKDIKVYVYCKSCGKSGTTVSGDYESACSAYNKGKNYERAIMSEGSWKR